MKHCKYCDTTKPLDEFHNCKKFPDGKAYKCKECAKETARQWNKSNKKRKAKQGKEWYEQNKELTVQRAAEWHKANPEAAQRSKKKASQKRIALGKSAAACAKRRAAKRQATPAWADLKEIEYVYSLAKERGLVVDHIVPLTSEEVCGLHTPDNLRCITAKWNSSKGNKHYPDQFGY